MGGPDMGGLILYGACNGGPWIVRNVPNPARNSRKIFTAHYAYRNVDLNLTLAKTQRYNIVVTLFRMAEILFQHLNAKNSRCELFRVNINFTDSFFE